MKSVAQDTKKVLIHEIFVSRQGEGLFVGEKQIFLRFSRCNIACTYCDTDNRVGAEASLEELAVTLEQLRWSEGPIHSVSLTGGEPLLHAAAILAVSDVARQMGLRVFLETNGTLPEEMCRVKPWVDIVSMDLKLPSVGKTRPFWKEHAAFLQACRGLERTLKIVVSEEVSLEELGQALSVIEEEDPTLPTVLQPVTPCGEVRAISPDTLRACHEIALARLWDVRIQPQWHKLWKVR